MAFMKRLTNIFNKSNQKVPHSNIESVVASLPFVDKNRSKKFVQNIYNFWQLHPQVPRKDTAPDANISEYRLYGKVLMLYAVGKGSPIKSSDEYPVYLYREGHITNPHKLHIALINDGYLVPATILQMLMARKMSELKIIADSIGCKKGGSKAVLSQRIISSINEEQLSKLAFQNDYYYLSEKGQQFLIDNNDYVELHKHPNYEISLYEYNLHRFCGQLKRTFTDTAFQTLSQRVYASRSESYFFTLEQDYLSLYDIAISECRYDMAIDAYLHMLYVKTCCFYNIMRMSIYTMHDFNSECVFSNSIASTLQNMEKFYHPNYIVNIFNDLSLPPSFLAESEFTSAIHNMLYETFCDLNKYNEIIRNRLYQYNELVIRTKS